MSLSICWRLAILQPTSGCFLIVSQSLLFSLSFFKRTFLGILILPISCSNAVCRRVFKLPFVKPIHLPIKRLICATLWECRYVFMSYALTLFRQAYITTSISILGQLLSWSLKKKATPVKEVAF